jgi:hypothetical protein
VTFPFPFSRSRSDTLLLPALMILLNEEAFDVPATSTDHDEETSDQ